MWTLRVRREVASESVIESLASVLSAGAVSTLPLIIATVDAFALVRAEISILRAAPGATSPPMCL
eukprot:15435514-Alexandrium_andersonii.AAC.1